MKVGTMYYGITKGKGIRIGSGTSAKALTIPIARVKILLKEAKKCNFPK
jgi:hypothetical protein